MYDDRDSFIHYEEIDGGAAATTATHTVPNGCSDRIVAAVMYHNHVGALNGRFVLYDATGSGHELNTSVAITGPGDRRSLYNDCPMGKAMLLKQGQRLQASVTGIGAGEHVFLLVWIERRKGECANY